MKDYFPKLKRNKTCAGCTAVNYISCLLGYDRSVKHDEKYYKLGLIQWIPMEACPKPRTIDQLWACCSFGRKDQLTPEEV